MEVFGAPVFGFLSLRETLDVYHISFEYVQCLGADLVMQEEGGSGFAPDLQEQIEGTLEELATRCVLELLALPLDMEHESQRQQGLQGLRSLLWTVDEEGHFPSLGGFTREQFMKEAFSLMAASEQVYLIVSVIGF